MSSSSRSHSSPMQSKENVRQASEVKTNPGQSAVPAAKPASNLAKNALKSSGKEMPMSPPGPAPDRAELLGSLTTQQQQRTSARVIKKLRLDDAADRDKRDVPEGDTPKLKEEEKETLKLITVKQRMPKALWSPEEKDLFFEALNEYGKDFDAITSYICAKMKKKGVSSPNTKTKNQVSHFYYRTWHKLSKHVRFDENVKKVAQELYALINYGELRKKLSSVQEKICSRLDELVALGALAVRARGRTLRVRTPACRALRNLNQLTEQGWEARVCGRCTVRLRARDSAGWARAQAAAHNPRLRLDLPLRTYNVCVCVRVSEQGWEARVCGRCTVRLRARDSAGWARAQAAAHNPRLRLDLPLRTLLRHVIAALQRRWQTKKYKRELFEIKDPDAEENNDDEEERLQNHLGLETDQLIVQESRLARRLALHVGPAPGAALHVPALLAPEHVSSHNICFTSYLQRCPPPSHPPTKLRTPKRQRKDSATDKESEAKKFKNDGNEARAPLDLDDTAVDGIELMASYKSLQEEHPSTEDEKLELNEEADGDKDSLSELEEDDKDNNDTDNESEREGKKEPTTLKNLKVKFRIRSKKRGGSIYTLISDMAKEDSPERKNEEEEIPKSAEDLSKTTEEKEENKSADVDLKTCETEKTSSMNTEEPIATEFQKDDDQSKITNDQAKLVSDQSKSSIDQVKAAVDQNVANDQVKVAKDQVKVANDQVRVTSDNVKVANDHVKVANDHVKVANDQVKVANDQVKVASDQVKVANDQIKVASDQVKVVSDQVKVVNDQVKVASDNVKVVNDQVKVANDQEKVADDNKMIEDVKEEEKIDPEEEHIKRQIRKGWSVYDAGELSIGDLYLMFGSRSKIELDYWWAEPTPPLLPPAPAPGPAHANKTSPVLETRVDKNAGDKNKLEKTPEKGTDSSLEDEKEKRESDTDIFSPKNAYSQDSNDGLSGDEKKGDQISVNDLKAASGTFRLSSKLVNRVDATDSAARMAHMTDRMKRLLALAGNPLFPAAAEARCACGHVCPAKKKHSELNNKPPQPPPAPAPAPPHVFRHPPPIAPKPDTEVPEPASVSDTELPPRRRGRARGRGGARGGERVVVQRLLPLLPKLPQPPSLIPVKLMPSPPQLPKLLPKPAPASVPEGHTLYVLSESKGQFFFHDGDKKIPITQEAVDTVKLESDETDSNADNKSEKPTLKDQPEGVVETQKVVIENFLPAESMSLSPSRLLAAAGCEGEGGPGGAWLEGGDFSLSSFLGRLEGKPPEMAVDSHLQSLLAESSMDYVAKFADLAAEVEGRGGGGRGGGRGGP